MSLKIQQLSPSYVTRSLLPQPYGTYILRYPTENDKIIASICFQNQPKEDPTTLRYVVLSIRVDETIYKRHIQHYRLRYSEQNIQGDIEKILTVYNKGQQKHKDKKYTLLTNELIPPDDDGEWLLNSKCFSDIDFTRTRNPGKNNDGISTAIWKCTRQNDIKVFIKRFKKGNPHFQHELSLLKDLCHCFVVTCYGQYSNSSGHFLVFEDAGESLESRCPLTYSPMNKKMNFIANVGFQVADAMMYLKEKNIVHRDLTAGNVLINAYGFIRVADFGHALKKEDGKNTLERQTTENNEYRFQRRFLPPECLSYPGKERISSTTSTIFCASFTSSSDVWSFGILIIQMFLEKDPSKPYPDITEDYDIPKHVKEEKQIHPQPSECPEVMYSILQACWTYEAIDRISFEEIRAKMFQLESIFRD